MKQPLLQSLGRLLLWVGLLAGPGHLLAQPTGCTSTYNATFGSTTAGGSSGLYGEYYAGQFHKASGFAEGSPVTFFANYSGATPVRRVDATVNYRDGGFNAPGSIIPPAQSGPNQFSARYRGSVFLQAGAPYTFYLTSDDASYLFVGKEATLASPTPDNALIKNGGDHGDVTVTNSSVSVAANGLLDLQIIYAQGNGGSTIVLEYSGGPNNLLRQVVPASALCAGPSGISYAANRAPSAVTATNTLIVNGTTVSLNPGISGFDIDGSVVSYEIISLPTSGTLRYNGAAIGPVSSASPLVVPAGSQGNLSYVAPATVGTFAFQYRTVDNQGASSTVASYTLPVQADGADLATTLNSPAQAPQGSLIYFTATTTNNGPRALGNVNTIIQLPVGLTGVSLSFSGVYNAANGQVTYPQYSLAVGATAERNIAFTMPATRVDGSATATNSNNITDPIASNNTGTSSTSPTQVADIEMVINGPTRVVPNQAIVYTTVATNLGPSTATGVSVRAQLPTNRTGVLISDGGTYNASTGVVTWPAVSALNPGSNLAYTVRFNAGATLGTVTASTSATSTTSGGDPVTTNNDGSNVRAQISTDIVSSLATLLCASPGADGNGSINSPPNSYYPGVGTAAAGTKTVTLGTILSTGSPTAIKTGDLIMLMQMQGAGISTSNSDAYGDGIGNDGLGSGNLIDGNFTVGRYEYVVVQSVSGNTLTLRNNLVYDYASVAASATQGQQRFQVVRVPQYQNLTLTGDVAAPRWNGLAGGVIVLDVSGVLNFNGRKIDAKGRGFRGGAGQSLTGANGVESTSYRHSNTLTTSANKGEGTAGTPRYLNENGTLLDTQASGLLPGGVSDGYPEGDRARGGAGNAGGGGTDGRPGANDENTGGGGGGNAGRGGQGGNAWNSNRPTGGNGGADFTQATPSRIVLGGGGGGGTTNNATVANAATYPANAGIPANGFASSGAAGGGIVLVRAASVSTNAGSIDVSGADMAYVPENDGSGGGGAGGSVVLLVNSANNNANSTVLQNITVLANGGNGGSNTGGGSPHGPGGGGGGGIIFASSTLNGATRSDPGANGTTFGFAQYGSGVGAADLGQAQVGITRADVPNVVDGCPADVQTTLTTNKTQAFPGESVTFTISTRNYGPGTATNVVRTITLVPNLPAAAITSQPAGSTYDPATGILTLAAIATIDAPNQGSPFRAVPDQTVTFLMPTRTVLGKAISTAGSADPATGNNDGTADNANVRVEALTQISGRVFDDVNYGGGAGRTYAVAAASAVASGISQIGSAGTTVELYDDAGTLVQTTTTGPDGVYGFDNVPTGLLGRTYTIRVVNSTVKSARTPGAVGVLPVQTFRVNGGTADPNRVGGENPALVDAGAAGSGATLTSLTASGATAQSIAQTATITALNRYENADFGFNFSTIVNTNDVGQGSLRQFINNANRLSQLNLDQAASSNGGDDPVRGTEKSIFMISNGTARPGLRSGLANQLSGPNNQQVARITLNTLANGALPGLTAANVSIDGTTQTLNVGNTNSLTLGVGGTVGTGATTLGLVSGPEIELVGAPSQANSQRGLTLANSGQSVKGLAIYGFGNTLSNIDGADIYVTGNATNGTVITGNVLGASATSFTDPGASARSRGNGVLFDNITLPTGVQVSATVSNNLVGFHGVSGVDFRAFGSPTALLITNNEIRSNGLTSSTSAAVRVSRNGGTVSGNLIADNRTAGINTQGSDGNVTITGNTVSNNGLDNVQTAGLRLGGTNNLVSANVIAGNRGAGVMALTTAALNRITQNSIYDNGLSMGQLGIDLLNASDNDQAGTADYVTKNANSKPPGGNSLLNFPVITQTAVNGNLLELVGYAPANALIEFFVADRTTPAFGQGKTYLFTATEGSTQAVAGSLYDRDTGTGSYSGLINGLDQGAETNARKFYFQFDLSTLSAAQRAAITATGARVTATATTRTSDNFTTSEFSGSAPFRINQPLPVTLVSFAAKAAGIDALLSWKTAAELNNAYFAVERSLDGRSFAEVGRRAGQGTSSQGQDYALTDVGIGNRAASQLVYYRLRQVDLDGTTAYSEVRTVRFGAAADVAVWPTPTSGNAALQLGRLPAGTYQVQVYDAAGRLVFASPAPGGQALPLPSAGWPSGSYVVRVTGTGSTHVTRLVKN